MRRYPKNRLKYRPLSNGNVAVSLNPTEVICDICGKVLDNKHIKSEKSINTMWYLMGVSVQKDIRELLNESDSEEAISYEEEVKEYCQACIDQAIMGFLADQRLNKKLEVTCMYPSIQGDVKDEGNQKT